MTIPPANRRKIRIVDRRFQLGVALRFLLAFLLFFAIGIFLVFAPSMFRLLTGASLSDLEPAAQEFLVLHRRIWPAVLVVLAGVFCYSLYIGQRIAGPIHRINSVLGKMLEGEYPGRVALRKDDHFRETAELLDRLAQRMDRREKTPEDRASPPDGSGIR